MSAAFSRDGAQLVTTGAEVRIWTLSVDPGTLHDWSEAAQRSPFQLDGGVLVLRSPQPEPETHPPPDSPPAR